MTCVHISLRGESVMGFGGVFIIFSESGTFVHSATGSGTTCHSFGLNFSSNEMNVDLPVAIFPSIEIFRGLTCCADRFDIVWQVGLV